MSKHVYVEIVGGLVILLLLGLIGWEQYNKAVGNAVAIESAKLTAKAQAEKDEALSARDKQYRDDLKEMQAKYATLSRMTPQQVVQKVPEYIPLATKPVVMWQPGMTPPEGSAIVPGEDIKPIANAILDGEKCKVDVAKCSADLIDWKAKYELKQKESDEWQRAAKGGSWLQRLRRDVIKVGIGVGIGYALKH